MTRGARRVVPVLLLLASTAPSRAEGPWFYTVTGPGGSSEIGPDQIGRVLYFQLDATAPDYVWGNVRVDFDPALLECVSVEETPFVEGFWTAWTPTPADPAVGGGGVLYRYDDGGLGSDWASTWVATYGPGVAGPVAAVDNAAGVIRFYTMTNAGGHAGSVPLRIGFRIERAGVAVFTTSANDWTAFGWPGAATAAPAGRGPTAAASVAEADAGGYSWRPEDLPYRITSQVTIHPPVRVVAIDVRPSGDGHCGRAPVKINVAILGGVDLDVTAVDVATISLEGMPVATVGRKARRLARYEDVDADGRVDLVVTVANTASLSGAIPVRLSAALRDGTAIEGTGALCAP
ncbi:MAG TPA: hypothetical protein VFL83_16990 [Anaeromyxobacter sp.]|nr:hypothetical protein [Anaeromyxobacter sp.]